MREVRWEFLRPSEMLEEQHRCPVIYVPVGSVEWHGPHLPQGTDMLLAYQHALRVAQEAGGVVHPPIFTGTERERPAHVLHNLGFPEDMYLVGMDFPKNDIACAYYPEEILAVLVREVIHRLVGQGYRLIVLMNAHGAENQINTLQRLAAEFSSKDNLRVVYAMTLPIHYDSEGHVFADVGHADLCETAEMMANFPKRVDVETLPPLDQPLYTETAIVDGPTWSGHPNPDFSIHPEYHPRQATAEKGEAYIRESVDRLANEVRALLQEMDRQ
jgi:creatinine amidohydrolase